MQLAESKPSYYEILELQPGASPQEIRNAYVRLKSTYGKDSAALYSIMDSSETLKLLQDIEEAFRILSHPEKRQAYDHQSGYEEIKLQPHQPAPRFAVANDRKPFADVVSIDRLPPMEDSAVTENLLLAPVTDFTSSSHIDAGIQAPLSSLPSSEKPTSPEEVTDLDHKIQEEKDWRGSFLREIRESRRISIEELAEYTKISKNYLKAIEAEDYEALPAAVFVRGFLLQLARRLQMPAEKVAATYLARYRQAKPE